jgi:hypothetical protein
MNWLSLFSGPLTAIAERLVLSGVSSVVAYGVGKGYVQAGDAATVGAAILTLASTAFGAFKNTASAKIKQVNNDTTNGAVVVPATPKNVQQKISSPVTEINQNAG